MQHNQGWVFVCDRTSLPQGTHLFFFLPGFAKGKKCHLETQHQSPEAEFCGPPMGLHCAVPQVFPSLWRRSCPQLTKFRPVWVHFKMHLRNVHVCIAGNTADGLASVVFHRQVAGLREEMICCSPHWYWVLIFYMLLFFSKWRCCFLPLTKLTSSKSKC